MLILGISVCLWAYYYQGFNDPELSRHHPIFLFLAGGIMMFWAIKDLFLIAFNPIMKVKYPKLYERLNGDFWTFLLGPVKDDR